MKLHILNTQNALKISTLFSLKYCYYLSSTISSLCYAYFTTVVSTKVPKSNRARGVLIRAGRGAENFQKFISGGRGAEIRHLRVLKP